jgi:hypothetical protein
MKKILVGVFIVLLTGCSTIQSGVDTVKKYWPRDHDPVMFDKVVELHIAIENLDCEHPNFTEIVSKSIRLTRYAELRNDPQAENLKGLESHLQKLKSSTNKIFCDLGKRTAIQRLDVAINAWRKR